MLNSSSFHLSIETRTPANAMMLSAFMMGLPCSVTPVWKLPHRHVQRCVFKAIPDPAKLAMKVNHVSSLSPALGFEDAYEL